MGIISEMDKTRNKLLFLVKVYLNVRRRTGSRSNVALDFMNLKWKLPSINDTFVVNDRKEENLTLITGGTANI